MLLSQRIASFSRGQADGLRKAMGKKKIDKMMEMEELFMKGGIANGYKEEQLKKIWNDWKEFAKYAFNKSHSTLRISKLLVTSLLPVLGVSDINKHASKNSLQACG